MGEYISKAQAIKAIKAMKSHEIGGAINGRWIPTGDKVGLDEICSCSECGSALIRTDNGMSLPFVKCLNYCPICGAKMERRADERINKR